MTFEQLKEKASSLPLESGIYIMRNAEGTVIYVGKAKKLRNRISQYFQDTASHSSKTRQMVSNIHHFDVIIASSEFEALVLECAQIKQYLPKYNILLKDDKGYPYLRLDMKQEYPTITLANKIENDGAQYYGPFGSRGVTQGLLKAICEALKLPSCSKKFPGDIGKDRVCLNYHLNLCTGWCQTQNSVELYRQTMEQARQLLNGNFKQVSDQLKEQMHKASDELNFELAAALRDRIKAIQTLSQKQLVSSFKQGELDVIGYGSTEVKACFAVLHYSGGALIDKEYEILACDDPQYTVSSLLKQYYLSRGSAPKTILLPFEIEDSSLFEELLYQKYGRRTYIKVPQRGDNVQLVTLACKNAQQEAQRLTDKDAQRNAVIASLGQMLGIPTPKRIESFDISNISGTDNVASMVVFSDGKPCKGAYRHFKIDLSGQQDDYLSMQQVLLRRFQNYLDSEKGFEELPELLLIDGGAAHCKVAFDILCELDIFVPVFGMVKDDRHRTRALVTWEGYEIRIDNQQSIFSFIGAIQEETHRFAISYHRKLRSKRLQKSVLDHIPGIGPKRKQELLKHFSSIAAIRAASLAELEHYLPANAANAVYDYFQNNKE